MIRFRLYFLIIILIGCEPEETPILGDGSIINYNQVDIGSDYCYQKYYNVDDDLIVAENLITDWDIAFSNSLDYTSIILNSAKGMRVTPFAVLFSPITIDAIVELGEWQYDNPNGDLLYTAFMNNNQQLNYCQSTNCICDNSLTNGEYTNGDYLIDKGYDCQDNHLGYCILRLHCTENHIYYIQIIENIFENGSWVYSDIIEIEKVDNSEFIYFSFDEKGVISIANFDWDLCFSQYTEFNVPPPTGNNNVPLPTYRVVGVLKSSDISVAIDSINSFEEITMENITDYDFSNHRNAIGYDWKSYDLLSDSYSIESTVYILQKNSNFYKISFLDFYNEMGETGSIKFQIKKILY